MGKMAWVKVFRGCLRDEKLHYIIKKYGHDSIVFWIGLLTECDLGVLEMDEEIFAEICIMDTQRLSELKKIFASDKFGLININGEGKIEISNWTTYQYSESYGRVNNFRKKQQRQHSNGSVTVEVEVEVDKEEEVEVDRKLIPPPLKWVTDYCKERKNGVNAQKWHDFYSAKGWMVGKTRMKDWQAAVRTWEQPQATTTDATQRDLERLRATNAD